jgi:hypothetical protein
MWQYMCIGHVMLFGGWSGHHSVMDLIHRQFNFNLTFETPPAVGSLRKYRFRVCTYDHHVLSVLSVKNMYQVGYAHGVGM